MTGFGNFLDQMSGWCLGKMPTQEDDRIARSKGTSTMFSQGQVGLEWNKGFFFEQMERNTKGVLPCQREQHVPVGFVH